MKSYTLFIAVVPFAAPAERNVPIVVEVPNNAIPLQVEYRSTGTAFHFLVPCDEKGVPIEEDSVLKAERG
jgi:hypothetical protein